jgi:hypothetical protein
MRRVSEPTIQRFFRSLDFVLALLASCDETVQRIRNKSLSETRNERPDEKFRPVEGGFWLQMFDEAFEVRHTQ